MAIILETTSAAITIGEAMNDEAASIAILGAKTFDAAFGCSTEPGNVAAFLAANYTTQAITAELANSKITTVVARDDVGQVLGMVQLNRFATDRCITGDPVTHAELQKLYVDSAAHGKGIGTKLILAVERLARVEGFQKLWLGVWEHNPKARALYSKLGYTKCGEVGFAVGSGMLTGWAMCKDL